MKNLRSIALAVLLIAPTLGACTTVGQALISIGQWTSSSTPAEVATYADATLAATLATKTVDALVNTVQFDRATLTEFATLNDGVHTAWLQLKAARDANQSLTYGAFNAALDAFNAYAAAHKVAPVTVPPKTS